MLSVATTILVVFLCLAVSVLVVHRRPQDKLVKIQLRPSAEPMREMRVVKQGSQRHMRQAAEVLLRLEQDFKAFLTKAAQAFPNDDVPRRIIERWNGKLFETRQHAAITEDKEKIKVCIRDEKNKLLKTEVARFVIMHELAHVGCNSWGHTDQFWETFKKLLEMANVLGFMTTAIPTQTTYCGTAVGSDPSACVRESTCDSAIER